MGNALSILSTLMVVATLFIKQPGTVTEVLGAEEEAVTQGQVIAKLDTAPLEEAVKTAEQAVTNAEIALEDAKDGEFKIKTAEYDPGDRHQ